MINKNKLRKDFKDKGYRTQKEVAAAINESPRGLSLFMNGHGSPKHRNEIWSKLNKLPCKPKYGLQDKLGPRPSRGPIRPSRGPIRPSRGPIGPSRGPIGPSSDEQNNLKPDILTNRKVREALNEWVRRTFTPNTEANELLQQWRNSGSPYILNEYVTRNSYYFKTIINALAKAQSYKEEIERLNLKIKELEARPTDVLGNKIKEILCANEISEEDLDDAVLIVANI